MLEFYMAYGQIVKTFIHLLSRYQYIKKIQFIDIKMTYTIKY